MGLTSDYAERDDNSSSSSGNSIEPVSRRVKMIFSVMANPNRIDILRILNSKGSLTYSDLKAQVGFRSKKESGKFAYHLRKLLKHSLVALNRAERKYVITNKGKLILNLTRQIEERSIMESGNIYVRTKDRMEEFNAHKITQSLVRETNMPPELAQKISEEVENKVHRMQGVYLTTPLVRDIVCSILLEHGYEDYRSRFSTIGIPLAEMTSMLADKNGNDIGLMVSSMVDVLLKEYYLFHTIPKDVADLHLSGDINIANISRWGVMPDTIFANIKELLDNNNSGSSNSSSSSSNNRLRLYGIDGMDDPLIKVSMLCSILGRYAAEEVVVHGITDMLDYESNTGRIRITSDGFARMLMLIASMTDSRISFVFNGFNKSMIGELLDGYAYYVKHAQLPRISMVLPSNNNHHHGDGNNDDLLAEYVDKIVDISSIGGSIALSNTLAGSKGLICKDEYGSLVLHSLSMNLPRLAYESNNDEVYFRARLALLLKPIVTALTARRVMIMESLKYILPLISDDSNGMDTTTTTNMVINMVDLPSSISNVLKQDDIVDVARKVRRTLVDKSREMGYAISIAMIDDGGASRLARLDGERYGKLPTGGSDYMQGMEVHAEDIPNLDANYYDEIIELSNIFDGGMTITLDISNVTPAMARNAVSDAMNRFGFFRIVSKGARICSRCGSKFNTATSTVMDNSSINANRCPNCKAHLISIK
ncbi:MAG: helix-turn-helix domain-containing protein [Candidatus Nitrosocaldus sp.]